MPLVEPSAPVVYICSPYRADTPEELEENLNNVRRYFRFALSQGYAPIATHFAVCSVLNDDDPAEREQGISLDVRYLTFCDELWVFGDRISAGMAHEIHTFQQIRRAGSHIKYFDKDCNRLKMTTRTQELMDYARESIERWNSNPAYASQIDLIKVLLLEMEKMGAEPKKPSMSLIKYMQLAEQCEHFDNKMLCTHGHVAPTDCATCTEWTKRVKPLQPAGTSSADVRAKEILKAAAKAADSWRDDHAYRQAAQIIDMLSKELANRLD